MLVFTIDACPSSVPPPSSPPYTMVYVTGNCSSGASLVAVPVVLSPVGTFGVIDPLSPIGVVYAQRDQFDALCDNLLTLRDHDIAMQIYFIVGEGGQLLVERISSEPVGDSAILMRLETKVDALGDRFKHVEHLLARELPATKAALLELNEKVEKLIKRLPHLPHHLDERQSE